MIRKTLIILAMYMVFPAFADDSRCTRTIGAVTIDGNVIVPAGRSCTLNGTRVKGNVELRDKAQVLIQNGATVIGNVQTDGANRVRILNSNINGNVQLTGITNSLRSLILHSHVGGTVDWNDNQAPLLIQYSDVDSDVKVNQNDRATGIYDNVIGGNLQCQSNVPAPRGARNIVDGNKEDQCARF
ncbi:MAG: hypothetical protein E6Q62_05560 [Nitrosomonas sp.]|nr:MAG: hypothetical protein E6Q62_05560 [Nitrosomonas sp.]